MRQVNKQFFFFHDCQQEMAFMTQQLGETSENWLQRIVLKNQNIF